MTAPVHMLHTEDTQQTTYYASIGRGQVLYSTLDPASTTAIDHPDLESAKSDPGFRTFAMQELAAGEIITLLREAPLETILRKDGQARKKMVDKILALGAEEIPADTNK